MTNYSVTLLGQNITEKVDVVRDLNNSIDYPNVSQYRVAEVTLEVDNSDGDFSYRNANNFFVRNRSRQDGEGASVVIRIENDVVFQGEITEFSSKPAIGTVQIICVDKSWRMSRDTLRDFGLTKRFRIHESPEDVLERSVAQGRVRGNASYPILPAALPASPGSESGFASLSEQMNPVDQLRTRGILNPLNFVIDTDGVKTEGGPLEVDINSYPQIQYKAPFRWRFALTVVRSILTAYGITNTQLIFPPVKTDADFNLRGRPGYETIAASNDRYDVPLAWEGYITDWVFYNNTFYFLRTVPRNDRLYESQIIAYRTNSQIWETVHRFPRGIEAWRLTNAGDTFYIMTSPSTTPYNARLRNSQVAITQFNISTNAVSVIANEGSTYPPQLAQGYALGFGEDTYHADSRGGFGTHNNVLYYRYQNGNTGGIARFPNLASVMSYQFDSHANDGGLAFDIDTVNERIYLAVSHRDGTDALLQAATVDIS